jgi:polysaccharide deacetylase family protein (PEP-CTERM system associated)
MKNALSFDVEDYFHVHAFSDTIAREDWDGIPTRVMECTRRILQVLREHNTLATFFVLGWVAERHPEIVREIAEDGHELASHGYGHEAVDELNVDAFRTDIQRSINSILAAFPAAHITGYRAPSFSINEKTPWAFEVLAAQGLTYDSSVSPATFHDRYGVPSAPRFAHPTLSSLLEIPPSTIRAFGCNWPVAGGGYFRLAPLQVTAWAIRRINREGQPAVVYLHPWEFDPEQPRIASAPLRSKFRHYINLRHTERRLRRMLQSFAFGSIQEVFHDQLAQYGKPR